MDTLCVFFEVETTFLNIATPSLHDVHEINRVNVSVCPSACFNAKTAGRILIIVNIFKNKT
jgi:hypothetical protein